jgi:dTMP kinase
MKHPGTLIMFDGPDGVGKTTQISLAKAALESAGKTVHVTRINGGSEFGEQLRTVVLSPTPRQALSDHYVFMAMHTELRQVLRPLLEAGEIVLMDRSPLSDWAYQKFGSSIDSPEFERNVDMSMDLFQPDLVICYTATLATIRQRMRQQASKADYFDSKDDGFFQNVIDGYDFAAKRYKATTIDAEQSAELVHQHTMKVITSVIN